MRLQKRSFLSLALASTLTLILGAAVLGLGGLFPVWSALLLSAVLTAATVYSSYQEDPSFAALRQPEPEGADSQLQAALENFQKEHQSLLEVREQLEAITRNLPGCLLRIRAYDFRVLYVSNGCRALTGFSPAEVQERFGESFPLAVRPEDRVRTRQFLDAARDTPREDCVLRFRPLTADGRLVWLMGRLSLVSPPEGEPFFYGVFLDVTDEQQALEELRISRERYQLILEQSDDIVCEWDMIADALTVSSKWENRFGYPAPTQHFTQKLLSSPNIYAGDLPALRDWLLETRRGLSPTTSVDVRIRTASGRFMWNRLAASVILGSDGRPERAVGLVQDIDKERRELDSLRTSASTDPLTGIYNKAAARRLAEEYLAEADGQSFAALMILDVDNFKAINDTHGHLYGDGVLCDIASRLRGLFRDTDIVGRVGGDEFMVFLKNLPSCQLLESKAESVTGMFRQYFRDRCQGGVSCSLGVALHPLHGQDFNDLYRRADLALYSAKAQGKNCWIMFSPDMEKECFPTPPPRK